MRPPLNNIEQLKNISRKMLDRLEQALEEEQANSDPKLKQDAHERMFGVKSSLAATLVTLAELMLRLEQADKTIGDDNTALNANAQALSASDIALVEAFVGKIKNNHIVPLTPKGD